MKKTLSAVTLSLTLFASTAFAATPTKGPEHTALVKEVRAYCTGLGVAQGTKMKVNIQEDGNFQVFAKAPGIGFNPSRGRPEFTTPTEAESFPLRQLAEGKISASGYISEFGPVVKLLK